VLTRRSRLARRVVVLRLILGVVDGGREQVGHASGGLSDDVGVHPERDRGISVPQPLGDDVYRDTTGQQERGVYVP
jgi:hypothetical protein